MKTNKSFDALSMPSAKPHLLLLLMLVIPLQTLLSQEPTSKSNGVYPTFGVGIGFFYPSDVNDFISADIASMGAIESYNTDMYMYLEVKGGVTFRMKNVDITGGLEYNIAPKYMLIEGSGSGSVTYIYNRLSPEVSANYYISNKNGKNAFFFGGGINYSFLSFEDYSASAPGFKIQLGYSMQFGKFNLQPYGAFRYTKATDSSTGAEDFILDYIGGQIGVNMSFHPPILYK